MKRAGIFELDPAGQPAGFSSYGNRDSEMSNNETISVDEALAFIADYADWNPPRNEYLAARRLIADGITNRDLDRALRPGNAGLQQRIDALIFGSAD